MMGLLLRRITWRGFCLWMAFGFLVALHIQDNHRRCVDDYVVGLPRLALQSALWPLAVIALRDTDVFVCESYFPVREWET
jgi:hypothetical protein